MELDDLPKPKPKLSLGDDLATISIEELRERVSAFEDEIVRVKAEIGRKEASRSAAASFFKT
jgi:uncharacterized small protein (DUF1192 family)